MRNRVTVAGLFLLLGAFVHDAAAQGRFPVIDMHMHARSSPGDPQFRQTVAAMETFREKYYGYIPLIADFSWATTELRDSL